MRWYRTQRPRVVATTVLYQLRLVVYPIIYRFFYIPGGLHHNYCTVDGSEIRLSPVEVQVVEIPWFTGFFLHHPKGGCATVSVSSFKPGCTSCTTRIPVTGGDMSFLVEIPSKKTLNQLTWHHCWHPGRKTCLHFWGFLCLKIGKLVSFSHEKSLPMRFHETNSHDQPWSAMRFFKTEGSDLFRPRTSRCQRICQGIISVCQHVACSSDFIRI